jgi:hypothetical protein
MMAVRPMAYQQSSPPGYPLSPGSVNEAFLCREPSDGGPARIGALTGPEWTGGPSGALYLAVRQGFRVLAQDFELFL